MVRTVMVRIFCEFVIKMIVKREDVPVKVSSFDKENL